MRSNSFRFRSSLRLFPPLQPAPARYDQVVGFAERSVLRRAVLAALTAWAGLACNTAKEEPKSMPPVTSVLEHEVKLIDGTAKKLSDYRGKALLIVNTASECMYTPQYAELQKLYLEYRDRGLEVLGFPSNDFGSQEPGSCEVIQGFVREQFAVTFPMFDKLHAKGAEIAPLYRTLTQGTAEGIRGDVSWNFTKFLVDAQGAVVARFEPKVSPTSAELKKAVEAALP